jgi:hypothetical protein
MSLWTEGEILAGAEKWNPLEDGPQPDNYIPPRWDGPHVIKRFTEALDVLRQLPLGQIFPKPARTSWPDWVRDWDELMGRCRDVESMSAEGKVSDEMYVAYKTWETDNNRSRRDPPTARQIKQMDEATAWPGRYLRPLRIEPSPFLCLCHANLYGIEPKRVYRATQASRNLKINHLDIPSLARSAAAVIGRGLNNDNVGIF